MCVCCVCVHVCVHVRVCVIAVPASRNEYQSIKLQLESETLPPKIPGNPPLNFHSLPPYEQADLEKKRLAGQVAIMNILYVHLCNV